jgi:hypothetical protein
VADAANSLPSGDEMLPALMKSHITDPPIPSVVGGTLMDDCVVDEPASVALPCSSSHDSALTDVDVPLQETEVALHDPQDDTRVEVPPAATASI